MRYERKYRLADDAFFQVRSVVETHHLSFRKQYPDRLVHNIYLDTPALSSFQDNLMGAMVREKYRIRWYGEVGKRVDRPVLELKRKVGELGDKYSQALEAFDMGKAWEVEAELRRQFVQLGKGFKPGVKGLPDKFMPYTSQDFLPEVQSLKPLVEKVAPPSVDPIPPSLLNAKVQFPSLRPVLMNSYLRSYYISRDHRFRLTIDRDLQFRGLDRMRSFDRLPQTDPAVIIEVKYESQYDDAYDDIGQYLPFRPGKNSKYVIGMLLVGQL